METVLVNKVIQGKNISYNGKNFILRKDKSYILLVLDYQGNPYSGGGYGYKWSVHEKYDRGGDRWGKEIGLWLNISGVNIWHKYEKPGYTSKNICMNSANKELKILTNLGIKVQIFDEEKN